MTADETKREILEEVKEVVSILARFFDRTMGDPPLGCMPGINSLTHIILRTGDVIGDGAIIDSYTPYGVLLSVEDFDDTGASSAQANIFVPYSNISMIREDTKS